MGFKSTLLPPIRGMIRRFHGTKKDFVPQILEEGLKVNPPRFNAGEAIKRSHPDDYDAIYTTVQPNFGYFDPTYDNDALVVLDIPKDWYRQVKRLPYNPELPSPPPKLKRWDEVSRIKAQQEYERLHPAEDANPYNLPEGWDDTPFEVFQTYQSIVPIQQGGRVDIFKQDIPKEFINEIIIPRGDDTYQTIVKPDRNLDWWNIDFGMDL